MYEYITNAEYAKNYYGNRVLFSEYEKKVLMSDGIINTQGNHVVIYLGIFSNLNAGTLSITKDNDDWFYVSMSGVVNPSGLISRVYKCDQLEGLLSLINHYKK